MRRSKLSPRTRQHPTSRVKTHSAHSKGVLGSISSPRLQKPGLNSHVSFSTDERVRRSPAAVPPLPNQTVLSKKSFSTSNDSKNAKDLTMLFSASLQLKSHLVPSDATPELAHLSPIDHEILRAQSPFTPRSTDSVLSYRAHLLNQAPVEVGSIRTPTPITEGQQQEVSSVLPPHSTKLTETSKVPVYSTDMAHKRLPQADNDNTFRHLILQNLQETVSRHRIPAAMEHVIDRSTSLNDLLKQQAREAGLLPASVKKKAAGLEGKSSATGDLQHSSSTSTHPTTHSTHGEAGDKNHHQTITTMAEPRPLTDWDNTMIEFAKIKAKYQYNYQMQPFLTDFNPDDDYSSHIGINVSNLHDPPYYHGQFMPVDIHPHRRLYEVYQREIPRWLRRVDATPVAQGQAGLRYMYSHLAPELARRLQIADHLYEALVLPHVDLGYTSISTDFNNAQYMLSNDPLSVQGINKMLQLATNKVKTLLEPFSEVGFESYQTSSFYKYEHSLGDLLKHNGTMNDTLPTKEVVEILDKSRLQTTTVAAYSASSALTTSHPPNPFHAGVFDTSGQISTSSSTPPALPSWDLTTKTTPEDAERLLRLQYSDSFDALPSSVKDLMVNLTLVDNTFGTNWLFHLKDTLSATTKPDLHDGPVSSAAMLPGTRASILPRGYESRATFIPYHQSGGVVDTGYHDNYEFHGRTNVESMLEVLRLLQLVPYASVPVTSDTAKVNLHTYVPSSPSLVSRMSGYSKHEQDIANLTLYDSKSPCSYLNPRFIQSASSSIHQTLYNHQSTTTNSSLHEKNDHQQITPQQHGKTFQSPFIPTIASPSPFTNDWVVSRAWVVCWSMLLGPVAQHSPQVIQEAIKVVCNRGDVLSALKMVSLFRHIRSTTHVEFYNHLDSINGNIQQSIIDPLNAVLHSIHHLGANNPVENQHRFGDLPLHTFSSNRVDASHLQPLHDELQKVLESTNNMLYWCSSQLEQLSNPLQKQSNQFFTANHLRAVCEYLYDLSSNVTRSMSTINTRINQLDATADGVNNASAIDDLKRLDIFRFLHAFPFDSLETIIHKRTKDQLCGVTRDFDDYNLYGPIFEACGRFHRDPQLVAIVLKHSLHSTPTLFHSTAFHQLRPVPGSIQQNSDFIMQAFSNYQHQLRAASQVMRDSSALSAVSRAQQWANIAIKANHALSIPTTSNPDSTIPSTLHTSSLSVGEPLLSVEAMNKAIYTPEHTRRLQQLNEGVLVVPDQELQIRIQHQLFALRELYRVCKHLVSSKAHKLSQKRIDTLFMTAFNDILQLYPPISSQFQALLDHHPSAIPMVDLSGKVYAGNHMPRQSVYIAALNALSQMSHSPQRPIVSTSDSFKLNRDGQMPPSNNPFASYRQELLPDEHPDALTLSKNPYREVVNLSQKVDPNSIVLSTVASNGPYRRIEPASLHAVQIDWHQVEHILDAATLNRDILDSPHRMVDILDIALKPKLIQGHIRSLLQHPLFTHLVSRLSPNHELSPLFTHSSSSRNHGDASGDNLSQLVSVFQSSDLLQRLTHSSPSTKSLLNIVKQAITEKTPLKQPKTQLSPLHLEKLTTKVLRASYAVHDLSQVSHAQHHSPSSSSSSMDPASFQHNLLRIVDQYILKQPVDHVSFLFTHVGVENYADHHLIGTPALVPSKSKLKQMYTAAIPQLNASTGALLKLISNAAASQSDPLSSSAEVPIYPGYHVTDMTLRYIIHQLSYSNLASVRPTYRADDHDMKTVISPQSAQQLLTILTKNMAQPSQDTVLALLKYAGSTNDSDLLWATVHHQISRSGVLQGYHDAQSTFPTINHSQNKDYRFNIPFAQRAINKRNNFNPSSEAKLLPSSTSSLPSTIPPMLSQFLIQQMRSVNRTQLLQAIDLANSNAVQKQLDVLRFRMAMNHTLMSTGVHDILDHASEKQVMKIHQDRQDHPIVNYDDSDFENTPNDLPSIDSTSTVNIDSGLTNTPIALPNHRLHSLASYISIPSTIAKQMTFPMIHHFYKMITSSFVSSRTSKTPELPPAEPSSNLPTTIQSRLGHASIQPLSPRFWTTLIDSALVLSQEQLHHDKDSMLLDHNLITSIDTFNQHQSSLTDFQRVLYALTQAEYQNALRYRLLFDQHIIANPLSVPDDIRSQNTLAAQYLGRSTPLTDDEFVQYLRGSHTDEQIDPHTLFKDAQLTNPTDTTHVAHVPHPAAQNLSHVLAIAPSVYSHLLSRLITIEVPTLTNHFIRFLSRLIRHNQSIHALLTPSPQPQTLPTHLRSATRPEVTDPLRTARDLDASRGNDDAPSQTKKKQQFNQAEQRERRISSTFRQSNPTHHLRPTKIYYDNRRWMSNNDTIPMEEDIGSPKTRDKRASNRKAPSQQLFTHRSTPSSTPTRKPKQHIERYDIQLKMPSLETVPPRHKGFHEESSVQQQFDPQSTQDDMMDDMVDDATLLEALYGGESFAPVLPDIHGQSPSKGGSTKSTQRRVAGAVNVSSTLMKRINASFAVVSQPRHGVTPKSLQSDGTLEQNSLLASDNPYRAQAVYEHARFHSVSDVNPGLHRATFLATNTTPTLSSLKPSSTESTAASAAASVDMARIAQHMHQRFPSMMTNHRDMISQMNAFYTSHTAKVFEYRRQRRAIPPELQDEAKEQTLYYAFVLGTSRRLHQQRTHYRNDPDIMLEPINPSISFYGQDIDCVFPAPLTTTPRLPVYTPQLSTRPLSINAPISTIERDRILPTFSFYGRYKTKDLFRQYAATFARRIRFSDGPTDRLPPHLDQIGASPTFQANTTYPRVPLNRFIPPPLPSYDEDQYDGQHFPHDSTSTSSSSVTNLSQMILKSADTAFSKGIPAYRPSIFTSYYGHLPIASYTHSLSALELPSIFQTGACDITSPRSRKMQYHFRAKPSAMQSELHSSELVHTIKATNSFSEYKRLVARRRAMQTIPDTLDVFQHHFLPSPRVFTQRLLHMPLFTPSQLSTTANATATLQSYFATMMCYAQQFQVAKRFIHMNNLYAVMNGRIYNEPSSSNPPVSMVSSSQSQPQHDKSKAKTRFIPLLNLVSPLPASIKVIYCRLLQQHYRIPLETSTQLLPDHQHNPSARIDAIKALNDRFISFTPQQQWCLVNDTLLFAVLGAFHRASSKSNTPQPQSQSQQQQEE